MKRVETLSLQELRKMAEEMYGNLVKAVVDVASGALVVDVEMHVDAEQELLELGSKQTDLWGINFHPDKFGTDEFVEFDSMINIRPKQQNLSRSVENEAIRTKIRTIVGQKVRP